MANEILSPSTLPSLICKGCPPGPSAVPVNFVPSCLKVNVIDMPPPPSGPPISPLHFPVTSAARARQVVSANRIAHLTVIDSHETGPLRSRYHRVFDGTVKLCKGAMCQMVSARYFRFSDL